MEKLKKGHWEIFIYFIGCTSDIVVGQFQNPQKADLSAVWAAFWPWARTCCIPNTFTTRKICHYLAYKSWWTARKDTGDFIPGQSQLSSKMHLLSLSIAATLYLVLLLQTQTPTPLTPGNKASHLALNRASMISTLTAWVLPAPVMQSPEPSCPTYNVFVLQWRPILKRGETRQSGMLFFEVWVRQQDKLGDRSRPPGTS